MQLKKVISYFRKYVFIMFQPPCCVGVSTFVYKYLWMITTQEMGKVASTHDRTLGKERWRERRDK